MTHPSDVLLALNSGAFATQAAAFDRRGRQLALVAVSMQPHHVGDRGVEQDLADTWQAVLRALRLLADEVPDMARRAVALAITGQADGSWLIDEDGDPVAPALLWLDGRASGLVDAWRADGTVAKAREITGAVLEPARQSAQLAWLERHRPELLEQAATVLHCADWLYFCCTGERVSDPAEALPAFGDPRAGTYDDRVLDLLGLEEAARLLPPILPDARHHRPITFAAAAACGLSEGTPVVLAPPDHLAGALGCGALDGGSGVACTLLDSPSVHLRACPRHDLDRLFNSSVSSIAPLPAGGFAGVVANTAGALHLDWLSDLSQQLLAELGLIGVARQELEAALDRRADEAMAGALLVQPALTRSVRSHLLDLTCRTGIGDLARGVYEGLAFAAREAHAALGDRPEEVRIGGRLAGRPIARRMLAAILGVPVRASRRADPAAAGAALVAAVALGQYATPAHALEDWVVPYLDPIEPVDPALAARYDGHFETWRSAQRRMAVTFGD